MQPPAEVLRRALEYPYAAPPTSFALVGGRAVDPRELELVVGERAALLAYGSNASPEVLRRKLGDDAEPLLAVRAMLEGFDVVYSAHVSAYGAIPGTLWPSPGARAPVFLLWLTEAQRAAITATEPNYRPASLRSVARAFDDGTAVDELTAYVSRHGALLLDGWPVALAAVDTEGRTLPVIDERAAIEVVRRRVCPGLSLERFVAEAATDPDLPRRWTAALRSDGREAAQGDARDRRVGGGQHDEVDERPADAGAGGIEGGGHRL